MVSKAAKTVEKRAAKLGFLRSPTKTGKTTARCRRQDTGRQRIRAVMDNMLTNQSPRSSNPEGQRDSEPIVIDLSQTMPDVIVCDSDDEAPVSNEQRTNDGDQSKTVDANDSVVEQVDVPLPQPPGQIGYSDYVVFPTKFSDVKLILLVNHSRIVLSGSARISCVYESVKLHGFKCEPCFQKPFRFPTKFSDVKLILLVNHSRIVLSGSARISCVYGSVKLHGFKCEPCFQKPSFRFPTKFSDVKLILLVNHSRIVLSGSALISCVYGSVKLHGFKCEPCFQKPSFRFPTKFSDVKLILLVNHSRIVLSGSARISCVYESVKLHGFKCEPCFQKPSFRFPTKFSDVKLILLVNHSRIVLSGSARISCVYGSVKLHGFKCEPCFQKPSFRFPTKFSDVKLILLVNHSRIVLSGSARISCVYGSVKLHGFKCEPGFQKPAADRYNTPTDWLQVSSSTVYWPAIITCTSTTAYSNECGKMIKDWLANPDSGSCCTDKARSQDTKALACLLVRPARPGTAGITKFLQGYFPGTFRV